MTFGSYWSQDDGQLLPTAASSRISHRRPAAGNYGDRGDAFDFSYGSGSTSKKGEKKQAAMSALTLIAFLFFLNILQNCLKDQMADETLSAVTLINPKLIQGRQPEMDEEHELQEETEKVLTRKLLSLEDDPETPRRRKFIHDFGLADSDWSNHLTQVTHQDLDDQKQKVDKLQKLWKSSKKQTMDDQVADVKVKKFINSPVLSDIRSIPKLSEYWASRRTTTEPSNSIDFEEPLKKVADFNEFEILSPVLNHEENSIVQQVAEKLLTTTTPPTPYFTRRSTTEEDIPSTIPLALGLKSAIGEVEAVPDPYDSDALNTPRYRRGSEVPSTTYPQDLFQADDSQLTTTSSTTMRTFHVYTHPSQMHRNMWQTTSPTLLTTAAVTTQAPPTTEKFNIEKIYLTTAIPMPSRIFGRNPSNHRPYYKPATRIDYSPYRRVGYEPPLVRHEYYPMSVVGQYNGGVSEGPGMGFLQLLWSLVMSFAKPIVNLVPNAKVGSDGTCVELLMCEAHRLGKYMGPSARLVATTFSTVVKWMAPASGREAIDDALSSAATNTCRRQIDVCNQRTGGNSMLTMLANIMEQKSQREPKGAKT